MKEKRVRRKYDTKIVIVPTVQSGVPLQKKRYPTTYRWPWNRMKIGDSISIPVDRLNAAKRSLYDYKKRHTDFDYVVRKSDNGKRYRIWRVAPDHRTCPRCGQLYPENQP